MRRQSTYHQRVHAFSISGVITVIVAVLWLHFHYGFWSSPENDVYVEGQSYEVRDLSNGTTSTSTEGGFPSPKETLSRFFNDAKTRMDSIPKSFSDSISETKIYQRPE